MDCKINSIQLLRVLYKLDMLSFNEMHDIFLDINGDLGELY